MSKSVVNRIEYIFSVFGVFFPPIIKQTLVQKKMTNPSNRLDTIRYQKPPLPLPLMIGALFLEEKLFTGRKKTV